MWNATWQRKYQLNAVRKSRGRSNTFGARYLGGLGEAETQGPVSYFADVPNPEFTPRIFTIGHYICLTAIAAIYGTLPGRPCAEVL
jgi:hypothetical protein